MIYQTFASLYDQLFDADLYDDWLAYTTARIAPGSRVLDLAGGAGRLAVLLAQNGYQVTDADLSAEMLSLADQHRQEAGVDLELVEADMTDLAGLPQYEAVTCFADSICYLPDLAAVQRCFQAVADHLPAGAPFFFDVISPYQTDEVYPGYTYNFEDEDHRRAFLWSSYANEEVAHGVIHDLAFFLRQADGCYQRVGETHFERTYALADYQAALTAAGFEDIQVTADFGRQPVDETTTRWFFAAKRGGRS